MVSEFINNKRKEINSKSISFIIIHKIIETNIVAEIANKIE
jgi:hypothetical protein